MESLTGSLTNVALLTFQKSMKHHFCSVKGLLYSILFSSVPSLHTLGTEFCFVKGWEKVLPPEQQGQDTAGAAPSHCFVTECLINKRWKKHCAKPNQWLFHEILLLTYLMVHTHKGASKSLFADFLPVFWYFSTCLCSFWCQMSLCVTDEKFCSWGVVADGTLPLHTENCGI